MTVPSEMPVRQYPLALRARVRVAYAVGWEALIDTHTDQMRQFIGEFATRVPPLVAMELYFAVVPVPDPMREAVRTRALASLDLDCLPPQTMLPGLAGWKLLRLDLVLKLIRFRRHYAETTFELARMVGARAAEAVTATHVNNAWDLAQLLADALPLERAVTEYLQAFYLPLPTAQTVMQRVKAAAAGQRLAAEYAAPHTAELELLRALAEPEPPMPPLSAPESAAPGVPAAARPG